MATFRDGGTRSQCQHHCALAEGWLCGLGVAGPREWSLLPGSAREVAKM